MHVLPFGDTNNALLRLFNYGIQNWFARIAVPFFFVSSGFLLYRKTPLENFSPERTKRYVVKLIRLYALWTLVYLPLKLKGILTDPQGLAHGVLFYLRDVVFVGSYWHLWYFPALIFAVIVISWLLSRRVSLKKILIAALCLYAVGLLGQSWFGLIKPLRLAAPDLWAALKAVQQVIFTTRNGLFEGLLFVAMGATFAYRGFKLPRRAALVGFLASYVLMFIEALTLKRLDFVLEEDMYVFLVPLTWCAFGLVVNCRMPGRAQTFKTLRVVSSLVFFIHWWVMVLLDKAFNLLGFAIGETCLLFVLTVCASIALSYGIYRLSLHPRLGWLKRLYS